MTLNNHDNKVIIIDNGTSLIKSGFSGDDCPRSVFPPIVGRPREQKGNVGWKYRDTYVGDEAYKPRQILGDNRDTIEHGKFTNWDEAEKIWSHLFYNELRVKPEHHPILLSEIPFLAQADREKMFEIFFEKFNLPSISSFLQSQLSLYSTGNLNGIVIDCGGGLTSAVPIINGEVLSNEFLNISSFGGKDACKFLSEKLIQINYGSFASSEQRHAVEEIKKNLCYVSLNYEKSLKSSENFHKSFQLPDGKEVKLEKERFTVGEVLFQPSIMSLNCQGVYQCFHTCFQKLEDSHKTALSTNIQICGGSTMLSGFTKRFEKEAQKMEFEYNLTVNAPNDRKFSTFVGASVFSSLSNHEQFQLKRREYLERGLLSRNF